MKIVIGSDHAAYELKQILIPFLAELGHEVEDVGAFTDEVPANDYLKIGASVSEAVVSGRADRGIAMCGSGVGMSMSTNKVPGARAVLCHNLYTAIKSREHNDANVLVLGSRITGLDLTKEIVTAWLTTPFGEGRHTPRMALLSEIEEQYKAHDDPISG